MDKELVFSVTKNDLKFDYTKGSGAGGQKRNKTSNAVRCTHPDSGAVGYAEDTRSQTQNKQLAFKRMTESNEFKMWINRRLFEEQISSDRKRKIDFAIRQVDEILSGNKSCEISIDGRLNLDIDYTDQSD